jgi:hypothetical protein
MIGNSLRQKKIKIPIKVDPKKEYMLLHILNSDQFPMYFELDANYLNLLYTQTKDPHIETLLQYAEEYGYFEIKTQMTLITESNIIEVNKSGDFFQIYHDHLHWNFFSIKNIIPGNDKKAINELLGIEELKIRFEE